MNIWIIDHYSSEPKYGGISRQYDFARELHRRGHNVIVISSSFSHFSHSYISSSKNFSSEVEKGVVYQYVKTIPYKKNNSLKRLFNMISFMFSVSKEAKKLSINYWKPDIIVGCSIHPFTWIVSYKLAKKFKARFFAEVRDLWPANQIYDEGKSKMNPEVIFWGILEKWTYKRAEKIIYSMGKGDEYLCNVVGVPREKVVLIGQPIDRKRYDENAKNYNLLPSQLLSFISDSFLCVFTGYFMDYEGVHEMLEAANIIKQQNLPIKFVFAGSGPEEEKMIKYKNDNDLSNVFISKRISKELIPALLRRADICLAHLAARGIPNSYIFDCSKNKINEYLYSHSCIIYGTYVKNQFVGTSGSGFTIEPFSSHEFAEKIKLVFNMKPNERKSFGENAEKYLLNNNTVEVLIDKYEKLF